jgi:hypothetical protein
MKRRFSRHSRKLVRRRLARMALKVGKGPLDHYFRRKKNPDAQAHHHKRKAKGAGEPSDAPVLNNPAVGALALVPLGLVKD